MCSEFGECVCDENYDVDDFDLSIESIKPLFLNFVNNYHGNGNNGMRDLNTHIVYIYQQIWMHNERRTIHLNITKCSIYQRTSGKSCEKSLNCLAFTLCTLTLP